MKKTNDLTLVLALLLSITFVFSASADSGTLRLGSISILSGEGSSWGTAAKNGVVLAVKDLNAEGGVLGQKVEVNYQDDQGDPKKTIAAFRHLTEVSGVNFIIGPTFSRSGLAIIDLAKQKQTLIISPSLGMAKFNESSEFLFNTWPHDYINSEKLADYVFKRGHRSVALVGAEEPWVKEQTNAFEKRFVALGGKIVFKTEPLPGTTDLKTEALRISKLKNLDAFVSTTDGVVIGSLVAKALKELSFKIPMYSISLDEAAIEAAAGGFEGLEFLTFLTPYPKFKSRYESEFGNTIDIGADSAYDAVMLLATAIENAKSMDTTLVAKELSKIQSYKGVSGHLIADGKGGFTKDCVVMKVKSGNQAILPEAK